MKTTYKILLLIISLYSCTSIHMINHEQAVYDELNKEFDSEEVSIIKVNHDVISAFAPRISLDSIRWQYDGQIKKSVKMIDTKEIIYESAWEGAKDGFTYGFFIGVGVSIVGVLLSEEGSENRYLSPVLATALIGIVGGLGYGVIGLPVGAAIGHTDRYIFHVPSDSISTK